MQLSLPSISRLKKSHTLLALAPLALLQFTSAHATDVNAECAAAYGSNWTPVVGQVTAPTPNSPRPVKGVIGMDPDFHTCVVRATNASTEPPTDFARNDYSRRQAFNADNTRFIVYASGGAWHMYDANTLAYIRQLNGLAGDAEPQWDAKDPNSLYYVATNGGMQLYKLNVEANTSTVAADFTGKLPWSTTARVLTKSEGSPSADGRYWCFMAETNAFGINGVFTYDLQTQTVIGSRSLTVAPDHVSMSASGRYCVVSHDYQSTGTVAWNPTFTASRQLHTTSEHSDLAIGANGDDIFTFVDFQSNAGDLVMVDVDTGDRTTLLSTYLEGTTTSYHISGKGFSKPGWIILGTYGHSGTTEKWLHERVMAVELKANPKIINLAHHHSYENGYWTEPQASVSRDFTHVLFSSNWGTTSATDVDAFMIRLPDNLLGATAPPVPPVADTTKPTVTATAAGTSGTITLSATASDNVGVTSVDFMVDGVLKGSDSSSPYSLPLDTKSLSNGSHSLVAIAYDAAANAGSSTAVSFSVQNTAPPVADTTAPTVTASVSNGNRQITYKASASDNVGVTRVEFWVDGVLKGSDTSSPYAMTVQSNSVSSGSHTLVAKAYDAAGNVKSSAQVSFKRNLR